MLMLKLMLMDMVTGVDMDTEDTVDTDTVDTVADIMARDPLMLNLILMPLPIAVDTMDVKGGPLKVMPKPTMVGITDMVDTADMEVTGMVMAVDMATMDKCHLSSQ